MKHNLIKRMTVALAAVFLVGTTTSLAVAQPQKAEASVERTYGGDYSKYQPSLYNNTGKDSFAITQMGGSTNGYIYDQATYSSHIQQGNARGWRMHNYIWDQTGANQYQTKQMLDYFLSKVQTPYGSIVALDYEAGASGDVEANTNNIIYGMQLIKQAGFTPMLYSYKPYLQAHVDVQRVLKAFPNSIWIAGYQNGLSVWPNYNYFASMPGVAIWQYSDYGGQQDLNVDLTGITQNGYGSKKGQAPSASTPVAQPQQSKPQVITKGSTWTDSLGDTWHSESGTFTTNTWLNLRWGARTSSSRITTLAPGSTVKYDAWSRHDGYVWLRQPRGNGQFGYIACRDAYTGEAYGTFK